MPVRRPPKEASTTALAPAGRALVSRFRLHAVTGTGATHGYTSSGARAVIGTHGSADLVLRDRTVSRFHCEIVVGDGPATIRDLGSRNGTCVDGVSIMEAHLRDGAVIRVGQTELRFEVGDDQVEIALAARDRFGGLVGRSPAMRSVFAILERAAATDTTVLILGETGTGKDAAAQAIHAESARRRGPFVIVDCAALPAGLLESELFGHARGAFTGAERDRIGAFEHATGGSLLLDEVGDLPLDLQPKLLRVIETHEVQRVGTNRRLSVDVRVMAATHRDLRAEVNARRFRSDLYYRLAVLEVTLPPLREHVEDIPVLIEAIIDNLGATASAEADLCRTGVFQAEAARHLWPGNVRELRNYVERSLALRRPAPLSADPDGFAAATVDADQPYRIARDRWLRGFERRYLGELLRRHGNNLSAVARTAGVDRVHLYRMLARCGLR